VAQTVASVLSNFKRPTKAVVTGGMPYANGPLHLGHLAGALLPPDIYARWLRMLIGGENVLFVCGTDDHGSTSEVSAIQSGMNIHDFIDSIHQKQKKTLERYSIQTDIYTGTSRAETFPHHAALAQEMLRKMYRNKMLNKRISKQWYDPKLNRFLPDRYIMGKCPNEKCSNTKAYSDDCDVCGAQYGPQELINPRSALSDATPVLKDTAHWWLDMWKVSDLLREWAQSKEKVWRKPVYREVINTVMPCIVFSNVDEQKFKDLKDKLPAHKSRYAPGKKIVVQFESLGALTRGQEIFAEHHIATSLLDGWAHRSITRDVSWGIPVPAEIDEEMAGKTLYVWPDSLIAPISFSKTALKARGENPERYREFWCDPKARIFQFLGQDNIYFYTLMQAALWLGSQDDPMRMPKEGEPQMTDVFGCFHLQVDGEKMSKSRGNFFSGDQLLDEKGYSCDQIRYFLALLSLPEKNSNFDFKTLDERNKFLAGPLNASFEKPISAAHSKYEGKIPDGKLLEKVESETVKIVSKYLRSMEKAEYSTLLFAIENYARIINSLFTQYRPHDDRYPENERKDALFSSFYILKNIMIMLYPFVPQTMDILRQSLNLPKDVFRIDELGIPIPAGHQVGAQQSYFPAVLS